MRWDLDANPWKTFDQCDNDTNVTKYYDAVANEGITLRWTAVGQHLI